MPTAYNIQIAMSQATVTVLQQGGFRLYGFKGVQTIMGGGVPVVWFASTTFALSTEMAWTDQYQAYTSMSAIIPNGQIVARAAYDAELDQTLLVTTHSGGGEVQNGGTLGAISILNETMGRITCGISEVIAGQASPLCAFPLYGKGLDVMAPTAHVLLMFSTLPVKTGTVIYQAHSQGVLIDLTGVTSRKVNYDSSQGWSWDGGAWAKTVPANADMVPLLITSNAALESKLLLSASRKLAVSADRV